MTDRITCEIANGVADVRLNRADKLNALDHKMFKALVEMGDELRANQSVRAVVLSGEGRAFCAGLDFSSFSKMADGLGESGSEESSQATPTDITDDVGKLPNRITHLGQQAVWAWQELQVPVIAAVKGVALGGGCQLALGADIRLVSPDARMSILEIRWGLIPDMCGTQLLHRLVGLDIAKELTFTGRIVGAAEAVGIGLATRVCEDPRADAIALATEIASKSPHAVQAAKRLLNNASTLSVAEGFKAEREEIGRLIGSANQVKAIKSYFEKRPAAYVDVER